MKINGVGAQMKMIKGKFYYPIPRDRDQAFFVSEVLFLRLYANPGFNRSSRDFGQGNKYQHV